jgi:hypothetical protein
MTPNDVPGDAITAETLTPWLLAIAPAVEPVRPLAPTSAPAPSPVPEPLRPAA